MIRIRMLVNINTFMQVEALSGREFEIVGGGLSVDTRRVVLMESCLDEGEGDIPRRKVKNGPPSQCSMFIGVQVGQWR